MTKLIKSIKTATSLWKFKSTIIIIAKINPFKSVLKKKKTRRASLPKTL